MRGAAWLAILTAALLWASVVVLANVIADHSGRIDDLEHEPTTTTAVVRGQGGESSRETSTTTGPGVRVRVDGACVGMSQADADRIGAPPCR